MNHINRLNTRKLDNEDRIKGLEEKRKELDDDIKDIKTKKLDQISKLKGQIESMSADFSQLLSGVLENMKNKIHEANDKWDQENDNAMLKRFEEYANTKQS